jgi:hypothetical protein
VIVMLLNQKGGVGEITLALHLAGHWARQRKRVTLTDADPQRRPRAPDRAAGATSAGDLDTARLTIDFTPALCGRIKIAACQRGEAVAAMQRALLAREFPDTDGGKS